MKQTGYDMLYLTACAVNNITPDSSCIALIDPDELFKMCQYHSMTAIVCTALESAGISNKKFTEAKLKAIRKNILLDSERKKICGTLEQYGIWYMPLKGTVLKELYPQTDVRQMSDNDILFDKIYRKTVLKIMKNLGYSAKYYGKGNHKGHMYSFRFKLYATLLVTGGAILLFLTKGSALISLYLTDTVGNGATDVALKYGQEYLAIMMVGLIPFAVNQSYATNIKETGQTFIPMLASFVAVGTNALLDYLMIFGIGPFPKMGVQGAALATVIARYIEALIVIIWAHMHRAKNRYLEGAYTGFGIPFAELKAILVKGFPLMMNEVMWAAGMTTVTQCYSVRGLDVVAGLNIASTITNLFNIVYLQLGSCISIVVGQYLGAGKLKEAKDADDKMIVFSVFCCVIMAALMFVVGGFFPGIYNTSEEIKGLATQFIAVSAIIMPFCAFSHASYFTLRSGGKTVVTFLFDSVFTWVIVVPAAYLLAHFTGLGIVSIYFLVQGTEMIKVIIGYYMVKSNVWVVQMV